ncbi:MAG TPA: DUF4337 domain-containing protein [Candidatus Acidoferrales bacterium]|nr:DUF4337 domain-containing protein [Candidatus Acidoferrales bacterium]
MSEEGLEVPEAGHASGPLEQWVAIFTAILAAFGAVVGFQGSHLMNEVLLKKNEAVLHKAEATDEWNHYQAVSTKSHVMELAQELVPPERAGQFGEKIKKYDAQKDELMAKARELDNASEAADRESANLDRPHVRLALAMIFLQIAISLASITALTRRRWLFIVAALNAAGGVGLWLSATLLGA